MGNDKIREKEDRMKYRKGNLVYFVTSAKEIREAVVLSSINGFCTIRFKDTGGGIRVRESRLYPSRQAAENSMPVIPDIRYKDEWF